MNSDRKPKIQKKGRKINQGKARNPKQLSKYKLVMLAMVLYRT